MRIIGGRYRGRRLIAPKGVQVRPTGDRAREALFNILEHGDPPVRGSRFLDLFAGTGAVGLEAMSRGAAEVALVETDPEAVKTIRANLKQLGEPENVRVWVQDATRLGPAPAPFDLAFLDPPYESRFAAPVLRALGQHWLAPGARAIVELAANERFEPPPGYQLEQERRYGAARFLFLRQV